MPLIKFCIKNNKATKVILKNEHAYLLVIDRNNLGYRIYSNFFMTTKQVDLNQMKNTNFIIIVVILMIGCASSLWPR